MIIRVCAFAIICVIGTVPGVAMIVDHEATDGIAVIHPYTSIHGDPPGLLVLGTDGQIYKLDKLGKLAMYDFPHDLELQWPVDFEEITEWTPLWYEIPGTLDHIKIVVHPGGLIRCVDGSRWFSRVVNKASWDNTGGDFELEWRKLPDHR